MSSQPLPSEFDNLLVKLRRADEHIEAFNTAAKEFWKGDVYAAEGQKDRKGRRVYRVTRVDLPPPALALHVSDAAHQLRSTLDHLIWLLARPTLKEEDKVAFPIVSHRRQWRPTRYKTPSVRRGVRTVIESLQPYHRRKWPDTYLLAQLQAISNWDKHRVLMTTVARVLDNKVRVRTDGRVQFGRVEHFLGVLKPGAILFRFEVTNSDHGAEVKVKPETTIVPVFEGHLHKDIRGRPVADMLIRCSQFIEREVLPRLAGFA